MSNVTSLKKGNIYFHAAFLDDELTIPVIDAWLGCTLESILNTVIYAADR